MIGFTAQEKRNRKKMKPQEDIINCLWNGNKFLLTFGRRASPMKKRRAVASSPLFQRLLCANREVRVLSAWYQNGASDTQQMLPLSHIANHARSRSSTSNTFSSTKLS